MPALETAVVDRLFDAPGGDAGPIRVDEIEGELPPLPHGTWYLNGPGGTYRHWLDGDGLLRALTVDATGVTFRSRFVRTRKFVEEAAAGRARYRVFGAARPGDRLNARETGLESPANVSVIAHGGVMLALGEQGQPWAFDPVTLDTIGPYTASGALTDITPFAAHGKVDPITGELVNFGVAFSAERPLLNVFRFDPDGRQVMRSRVPLPYSCTVHDFALGPTHAAFYVAPYVLDMSALRAGASVMEALTWRPDLGSRVLLVARDSGHLVASIDVGNRYCLHTINCFGADGRLVLDVVEMTRPVYDAYAVPGIFARHIDATPVRLVIDPATGRLVSRSTLSGSSAPEFASIDPRDAMREYAEFWALGMSTARSDEPKFFDRLIRARWDTAGECDVYTAPSDRRLGGEPLIVANEHGRWALCQVFDLAGGRSGFLVFASDRIAAGPVATAWLPSPTPMAFHGVFVPRRTP